MAEAAAGAHQVRVEGTPDGVLLSLWRVFWATTLTFWKDNAPGMAGMIAFFGFLSAVPLAILLLAVTGDLLNARVSANDIEQVFHGVMPGLTRSQFLSTYWFPIRHSRVATTLLGAVSLLFGTLGLHDSVDWAVNRIWRSQRSRSFWVAKLRGLGVVLWATAFAVLSLGLTSLWAVLLEFAHGPAAVLLGIAAFVPSVLVDVAIFTALYRLTPMESVRTRPALIAGLVAAPLWAISKLVFGWWVVSVSTYNTVYGPLAASVIVMLWMWISAMIFLYGAALSATLQPDRDDLAH